MFLLMLNQGICFFLHSSSGISLGAVLCFGKIWNSYGNTSTKIVTIMTHLFPFLFLYAPLLVNREDKDTPKGFEFAWCGFLFWSRSDLEGLGILHPFFTIPLSSFCIRESLWSALGRGELLSSFSSFLALGTRIVTIVKLGCLLPFYSYIILFLPVPLVKQWS